MSVPSELYDALAALGVASAVYDTKLPDNYALTSTVIVFSLVSDVPRVPIDGAIIGREQTWQVSVRSTSLGSARAAATSIIAALHGLSTASIKRADFDNMQEIVERYEGKPPEFHIPIDFTVVS